MSDFKNMPETYWKEKLTPEQYKVCRMKGTERAFTGALYNNHEKGMYECVACGEPLFEVADQPGVHLRGELAALGLIVPDVQADDPVRLGPGGFQPRPDIPERGVFVVDLVQDGFRRPPEHRGQGVAGREHPPPDAGQ